MGLCALGAPADEYEAEALACVAALRGSELCSAVDFKEAARAFLLAAPRKLESLESLEEETLCAALNDSLRALFGCETTTLVPSECAALLQTLLALQT